MKATSITLAWLALAPLFCFAGGPPHEDAEVLRATLPNGLRVVAVRSPLARVVTTILSYLVGANETPEGFPGMAHAEEHMMFRGSPGLSSAALAKIGAALGGDFNADAKQTVTQYFFTVPAESLDVVLQLEAIRMRSVLNDQELWEKERGAILQEVAQYLSNPEYLLSQKIRAALFEGSAYAHDPLGTISSFGKTTEAMLRAFHRTWYAPNNAVIVIAGDVEPKRAIAEVRKHFASIPAKTIPPKAKIDLKPVRPAMFELDTDERDGQVTISFRLPGTASADFAAAAVLSDLLASKSGTLYELVASGKALSVGFSLDPLPAASIATARAGFPRGGDSAVLTDEVRKVLLDVSRVGANADRVEAAKRRQILNAEIETSSIWGLAVAWSRALAIEGRSSPNDAIEAIRKVTPADVARVAHEYLDLEHAVVGILTPRPSGRPVTSRPVRGPESSLPTSPTRSIPFPKWAAKATRRTSIPASALRPSVRVLSNGFELIVQPVSTSGAVFVLGQVKSEPSLEVPPGKEGVDEVLAQIFSFGTTSLDRVAFQRALDDIGAEESAGVSFSLRVLTEHFDRGIELLADHLLHPALQEEFLRVGQRRVAAAAAGQLGTPDYLASRALRAALLPAGDPRLREIIPSTVNALTLDDVRNYYERSFRPDLTKIVVLGNVSPEQAEEVVARHFGGWKSVGPAPAILFPPVPVNKPASTSVPDATSLQSKVTLAQTLGITPSDADYYALQLGNHVLVGAFEATRLNRALRAETGLVYGVSSTFDVRKSLAFYAVRFACEPGNVALAREIVIRNLEQMRTTLVSPAELDQARALVLTEILLRESSVEGVARDLLWRAIEGLPLDEPTRAARRYAAFTAEDVRDAFKKWIRPEDLVEVIKGATLQ